MVLFFERARSVGPKLIPFFSSVATYFIIFTPYDKPSILGTILKCIPLFCLMLFVFLQGIRTAAEFKYSRRIFIGLTFCSIGDAFLIWPKYFEIGMIFFAIGHINYIKAFTFKPLNAPLGVFLIALASLGISYVSPGLKGIIFPGVSIYTYILAVTVWRGMARVENFEDLWTWSKVCSFCGGILFAISDLIIGIDRFRYPVQNAQMWIMTTYYAAQFAIALSIVK